MEFMDTQQPRRYEMKSLLTLCLLATFLTTAALAGDVVEDVIAAEMDSRVQEMAGNVDGYFKYKGSTYTIFPVHNI